MTFIGQKTSIVDKDCEYFVNGFSMRGIDFYKRTKGEIAMEKLMKMRIQKRLTRSALITVVLASVSAVIAAILLFVVSWQYDQVLTYNAFPQGDIGIAMKELADVRSATRGAIGYDEQSLIDQMTKTHDEAVAGLQECMPKIEETQKSAEEREQFKQLQESVDNYLKIDDEIIKLGGTTDEVKSKKAQNMAIDDLAPAYQAAEEAFQDLMDVNVQKGDATQEALAITSVVMLIVIALIILAACFAAVKIGGKIAKSISDPIEALGKRLETFSQGDLTTPFPEYDNDDEVGDMVKSAVDMANKLSDIIADLEGLLAEMSKGNFAVSTSCEEEYVGELTTLLTSFNTTKTEIDGSLKEVRDSSEMVSAGALNLAEASQALAEGATDQAASAEELQATIDEITEGLKNTVDQTNLASQEAERIAGKAEDSRAQMDLMVEAMQRISETSEMIGSVITEIEDIASQTNLLSLNASIEAARAGEAGKGFAVVADEIGKLADQSNTSAEQIRQTIDNLLEESEKSVEVMESVNVLVAEQQEKLNQTREKFVRVSKGITTSKDDMEVIKSHTDSYFVARKKVADIIQNLSAISEEYAASTQQTTASMEELNATMNLLAEASKNLTDLSRQLDEEIAFFQIDD